MRSLIRSFCIAGIISIGLFSNGSAQGLFIDPFQNLSELCGMNRDEILVNCPDMPLVHHFGKFESEESFITAYKSWVVANSDQFDYFKSRCLKARQNISWSSMGLEDAVAPVLPDSLRQGYTYFLYEVLKMNYNRVAELAPHFPAYTKTGDFKKDSINFEQQYIQWSKSYIREVENIYNSDENRSLLGSEFQLLVLGVPADSLSSSKQSTDEQMALSKGTGSSVSIASLPEFLFAPISAVRPNGSLDKALLKDKVTTAEEMEQIQKWFWVYDTDAYVAWFGDLPELPETFNESKFRADAMNDKLNPNPSGYFYATGTSGEIIGEAFDFHHDPALPDFMYAEISAERPMELNNQDTVSEKSIIDINAIKKWLLLFEPETYVSRFGQVPVLRNGFLIDQYKADVVNGSSSNPDDLKYYPSH